MGCKPVETFTKSTFWIGFAIGVLATLLVGKIAGWLAF